MAETSSMNEVKLLEIISELKPQTSLAIEAVYEGISVPDFTRNEIADPLRGDANSNSIISKTIQICRHSGLYEQVQPERPRYTFARSPSYYKATPLAFVFAEAHNRLHTRLIREQLAEELSFRTIIETALGGYARHTRLPAARNVDLQELAQKVGLHPQAVIHRALGGYAMSMGIHRKVSVARTRLTREQGSA